MSLSNSKKRARQKRSKPSEDKEGLSANDIAHTRRRAEEPGVKKRRGKKRKPKKRGR